MISGINLYKSGSKMGCCVGSYAGSASLPLFDLKHVTSPLSAYFPFVIA